MLSLYVHIPFCHRKCNYCSFHIIPLDNVNANPKDITEVFQLSRNHDETTVQSFWNGDKTTLWGQFITAYLEALHRQIDTFWNQKDKIETQSPNHQITNTSIHTLYFWWGTPSIIGSHEMIRLIDHIGQVRDIGDLAELSIEINPDPTDEMLEFIGTISKYYKHLPRVRFSIGIQSFDNEVLADSGRNYNFAACVDFLRKLVPLKMDHNVFNFDFIAFGKFNTTRKGDKQLRDSVRLDFFKQFVHSGFADSLSLYTLELFEWSDRYNQQIPHYSHIKEWFGLKKYGTDDDVYEEYEILQSIIMDAGYQRYEISNYSLAGKNSIHNRVYRSMGEWLGLGTGATSYLSSSSFRGLWLMQDVSGDPLPLEKKNLLKEESEIQTFGIHFTTTSSLKEFIAGHYIDEKKTEYLTESDYLKEKFLMGLRTMEWIQIEDYEWTIIANASETIHTNEWKKSCSILLDNRQEKAKLYEKQGLCILTDDNFRLTDTGMDVYNSVVIELMK